MKNIILKFLNESLKEGFKQGSQRFLMEQYQEFQVMKEEEEGQDLD